MRVTTFLLALFLASINQLSIAQGYMTVIIDAKHLAIVNENGAIRLASEIGHNNMLGKIQENIDDINLNLASMGLVQRMIHGALSNVSEIQKTGRQAMQLTRLVQEIAAESAGMLNQAKGEPWLLLFAENAARQLKDRGVNLAAEGSSFVLKQGANVLMDYAKRDQLLRKIILELKVIRALLYSMQRSMFYAKMNGVLRSANPYRDFINRDRRLVDEIIHNSGMLGR